MTAGVPQGSIFGTLLFNMFMNDLAYVVNQSELSAYADDTQIFHADQDPAKVQETINSDLANVDKWYAENGMKRNYTKYQAIVMEKSAETKPEFSCENTVIKNSDVLELLGVTVNEKLKFGMHVNKVCRKVSQQVAVLKRMRNMLPFETRLSTYTSAQRDPAPLGQDLAKAGLRCASGK
ncbi:Hypothetical predicted protein, partial [Paramuricea clavata]